MSSSQLEAGQTLPGFSIGNRAGHDRDGVQHNHMLNAIRKKLVGARIAIAGLAEFQGQRARWGGEPLQLTAPVSLLRKVLCQSPRSSPPLDQKQFHRRY